MKIPAMILFTTLLAVCHRPAGLDRLIQPGAQLETLSDSFLFTEGPAADAQGNIYFTDQPNDRILTWSTTGELSVFLQPCGRSNGLFFDREGNLWACADEQNQLWRIDPAGNRTVMLEGYEGRRLNGPNDLWIAPDGTIYFTDPWYPRAWWTHTEQPQDLRGVYRFHPQTGELERVANDLVQPNGIVGTPDGSTLYVADIGDNKTWRYAIQPDGSLSGKSLFCELGSDGMTIDNRGNVYLTGQGVTVFDRRGRLIGNIPVPESWTANVCFGGKDGNELYITASKGLYRMRMKANGI
ncbi:MAG: SMP-30/gluconolactonase/LRE family protein [Bacteroidales bacterium]